MRDLTERLREERQPDLPIRGSVLVFTILACALATSRLGDDPLDWAAKIALLLVTLWILVVLGVRAGVFPPEE